MSYPIKIYTDYSSVADGQLKNLSPWLSFHWNGLDSKAIAAGSHNPASPLQIVERPSDADFVVLPMLWSYYLWNQHRNMTEARSLAQLATANQKRIVIWHKGDLVPVIPFPNSITFLPGIVISRKRSNQRACPVFVKDPADVCGRIDKLYRDKTERPTVGFCGYASLSAPKIGWSILKGAQLAALSKLGRYDFECVPVIPATFLRARALKLISRHPMIDSNFVIRTKHTPTLPHGRSPSQSRVDLERAFYSNIYGSDYTLCLRGYGNWSYRFYETLACGRIPILIDTECVLPSVPNVSWRDYCVWVDKSEIQYVGEKIVDFHSSLSPAQFVELQRACRNLWEKHLTPNGFMADAAAHLRDPGDEPTNSD